MHLFEFSIYLTFAIALSSHDINKRKCHQKHNIIGRIGSNNIKKHPPVPILAHSANNKKLNRENAIQIDQSEVTTSILITLINSLH